MPGLDEYRSDPRFLADRIYVIGQSKTRIAYVTEPANEACDCYRWEIEVEDLLFSNMVWKDSYQSDLEPEGVPQLTNLDQLWRARGADWERHLREQAVPHVAPPALKTLPTGGTTVPRFELHTEEVDDTSPEGFAHLTSYRVDLVTAEQTTTITRSSSRERNLQAVEILGYVPAIDDGMSAVLVLETRRGWEGPPAVHRLHFVGADIRD